MPICSRPRKAGPDPPYRAVSLKVYSRGRLTAKAHAAGRPPLPHTLPSVPAVPQTCLPNLLLQGHCLCCSIHLQSSLNQTFQNISLVRAQRVTFSQVCLKWPLCLTLYSHLNSVPGPAPPPTEGEFLGAGVMASKAPVSRGLPNE